MPDTRRPDTISALGVATIAAHGVRAPAPETLPEGERSTPSAEPIYQAAVYDFPTVEASEKPLLQEGGWVYARYGHPNARTLELTVAALEGTEDAVATASGMAALACTVLACASAGDRVLVQGDAYGGTVAMLRQDFARMGIQVEAFDAYAGLPAGAAGAKAVIVETISNPLVREVDVAGLAGRGPALIVDNTFATPIVTRPAEQGADAVIHSATKFLGGHHDLTAGVVCGGRELCGRVRGVVKRLGAQASVFDAWLASRGIKTLGVRVERAQENARALAARLREHRAVRAVHYPGRGAVLSFEVADAPAVVAAARLITLTPSLGGTTTTFSHPASSSHRGFTPAERAALGIADGLLRLSVGIEAVDDIWRDLSAALPRA